MEKISELKPYEKVIGEIENYDKTKYYKVKQGRIIEIDITCPEYKAQCKVWSKNSMERKRLVAEKYRVMQQKRYDKKVQKEAVKREKELVREERRAERVAAKMVKETERIASLKAKVMVAEQSGLEKRKRLALRLSRVNQKLLQKD